MTTILVDADHYRELVALVERLRQEIHDLKNELHAARLKLRLYDAAGLK